MIKLTLRNGDKTENVEFPCSEKRLAEVEELLHLDSIPLIEEVLYPKQLSSVAGHFADYDEINYLAKRMESFDENELKCFLAVAQSRKMAYLPDLINLTFNYGMYVLISDLSDLQSVGRKYVLTTRGCVETDELYKMELEKIGQDLLNSGKGEITECGILFRNEEWKYDEPYNGENFPLYDYKSSAAVVELTYGEKREYLYLPDEDIAIDKAVKRLGAENCKECKYGFDSYGFIDTYDSYIEKLLKKAFDSEGIYAVNKLLGYIERILSSGDNAEKLAAIIEYTQRSDTKSIKNIADNFDAFVFIENATEYEEVGRYFIENVYELYYDTELEDFIDFDGYGESINDGLDGEFINDRGYVCLKRYISMKEIFNDDENEQLTQTM